MKTEKILFIGGGFNYKEGGIQRYNNTMLKMLMKSGFEITCVSLNDSDIKLGNQKIHGFERNFSKFLIFVFIQFLLNKYIILGHKNFLPLLYITKFLLLKKTIILIVHGVEVWEAQSKRNINLSKSVSQVWAVSKFTMEMFVKYFKFDREVKIIPNVIPDFIEIESTEFIERKHKEAKKLIFLSVCRLTKAESYKGVDHCIKALDLMFKEKPFDFEYHIVAYGDDVERHKLLIEETSCFASFIVHHQITDNELKSFYKDSHIFLLPSTGEGFGIVYLEAMANGAVCIGADYGGIPDVIQNNENGLLTNTPVNFIELANQIRFLLRPEFRTGLCLQAVESIKKFSFESVSQKVVKALLESKSKI